MSRPFASGNGTTASYSYYVDGIRTSKTVNGTKTKYRYLGGQLMYEKRGSAAEIFYQYDTSGTPYAFLYNGTLYYYVTNSRGDITSILDETGATVAEYVYDSWGKIVSSTGTAANFQSLRYRSYVYDTETGLYYLQSRYYDPEVCRFLNADGLVETPGIHGANMFSYCSNNPVNFSDPNGMCEWHAKSDIASQMQAKTMGCLAPRSYPAGSVKKTFKATGLDGDIIVETTIIYHQTANNHNRPKITLLHVSSKVTHLSSQLRINSISGAYSVTGHSVKFSTIGNFEIDCNLPYVDDAEHFGSVGLSVDYYYTRGTSSKQMLLSVCNNAYGSYYYDHNWKVVEERQLNPTEILIEALQRGAR